MAVAWTTPTNWVADIRLAAGTNTIVVEGYDQNGVVLAAAPVQAVSDGAVASEEPLILINEVMAANTCTTADPADGDYDDWFELYNPNDFAVDLGGYRISDDTNNPAKFTFAAGLRIEARGFLLVWADEEGSQSTGTGQPHVNFKLSRDGETLALYGPSGKPMDLVAFGAQGSDVSFGRWFQDGVITLAALNKATPGMENQPSLTPVLKCSPALEGRLTLSWNAIAGEEYVVESSSCLAPSAWEPVMYLVPTSGSASLDVEMDSRSQFYRVKLSR